MNAWQEAVFKCEWKNISGGHWSHAYGGYQMMLTRNDAMQQVAFERQKLIWAGLPQPAP